MKIKSLHIRNIASIESADIDFEKGLCDGVTGDPASVFLITGDTGSGKTAILDAISLALYKTTPRIAGVKNVRQNNFVDGKGESVGIGSLEQYTRLGISEKEDCFSEVIFEGNDGVEYTARLTLGISRGNRNAEGNRPYQYKSPKWTLQKGTEAPIDRVKDVEALIAHAIGLSFEQFSRMVMLAQGQFATFLTGDKKEREAVLEQLTNTEHFSKYGEAIRNLYNKAKDSVKTVQAQYDNERQHTLAPQEVEKLTQDQSRLQSELNELKSQIEKTDQTINAIHKINEEEKKVANCENELRNLHERKAGEEFKEKQKLVGDWDNTQAQRQALVAVDEANKNIAQAESEKLRAASNFQILSADLRYREDELQSVENKLNQVQSFLNSQVEKAALYDRVGEWGQKIENLNGLEIKKQKLEKSIADLQAQIPDLQKNAEKAQQLEVEVKAKVDERKNMIDALTQQREALNPEKIASDIESLHHQQTRIESLKKSYAEWQKGSDTAVRLSQELQQEAASLQSKRDAYLQEKQQYETQKQLFEAAKNRFDTMNMSVEDTLRALRQKMQEEHVDTCPLCGQQIDHLLMDEDFTDLLKPLEEEKQKCAEALALAEQKVNELFSDCNQLEGSLKSKRTQCDDITLQSSKLSHQLTQELAPFDIALSQDTPSLLQIKLDEISSSQDELKAQQKQAEEIFQKMAVENNEKSRLEAEFANVQKCAMHAQNCVKQNEESIAAFQTQLSENKSETITLQDDLHAVLSPFYPLWSEDLSQTKDALQQEAKHFSDKQKESDALSKEKSQKEQTLTTILGIRNNLIEKCPAWNSLVEAKKADYPDQGIVEAWSKVDRYVAQLLERIDTNRKNLSNNQQIVEDYYQNTGENEHHLRRLIESQSQIDTMRKDLQEVNNQENLYATNKAAAQQAIADTRSNLNLSEGDELPNIEDFVMQKQGLEQQKDRLVAELGAIHEQLKSNSENAARLCDIAQNLEQVKAQERRWAVLDHYFGGSKFRTLVQTYILRPLLNNANIYLERITDRYFLTCSEENEQLSILVLDRYNKDQVRSVTVLSGGERFMISLALSLALSSLNRANMNTNILFIDEGFGTLDERSLDMVMSTLERLSEIAGQGERRVGIISHREELKERIPTQIRVLKQGEGRSRVEVG